MSMMSHHEIECPECGKSQKVDVWRSINVDLDASLRDRLIAGEINQFRCSSCGYEAFLDVSFLYHDMTREFCVYYLSPSSFDDPENEFQEFDVAGRTDVGELAEKMGASYLTTPHIVFDLNEMILYILFREFLHSRGNES